MDHATADLILTLQFEDLMSLNQNTHLGPASSGSTDAEVALELYRNELRNNALLLSDNQLSTKFGGADRAEDQLPSPIESPTPTFDHVLTRYEEGRIQYCTACGDGHATRCLITVPCGHYYCKPCVGGIDGVDETEAPIPLDAAHPFLNEIQIQQFEEKVVEHATTNKTYCHNTQCGEFILPSRITGDKAECPRCDLTTCSVCKAIAHDGDCPEDPAYISLVELAETEGWKQCEQCKRLVELNYAFAKRISATSAASNGTNACAHNETQSA